MAAIISVVNKSGLLGSFWRAEQVNQISDALSNVLGIVDTEQIGPDRLVLPKLAGAGSTAKMYYDKTLLKPLIYDSGAHWLNFAAVRQIVKSDEDTIGQTIIGFSGGGDNDWHNIEQYLISGLVTSGGRLKVICVPSVTDTTSNGGTINISTSLGSNSIDGLFRLQLNGLPERDIQIGDFAYANLNEFWPISSLHWDFAVPAGTYDIQIQANASFCDKIQLFPGASLLAIEYS